MRRSTFLKGTLKITALALAVSGFTGCDKKDGNEIIVGEFASLTGGTATFGPSAHKGTVMAIKEINAAGGLLGKKILLITSPICGNRDDDIY